MDGFQNKDVKLKDGFLGQRMIVLPKKVKSDVTSNPLINTLFITDIGFFPRARNHFRERKSGGKEYILIYCIEGRGIVEIYNQKTVIVPNTFYIIPPNTPHRYNAIPEEPWSIYWMHFRGEHAQHLYKKYCKNGKPSVSEISFEEKRVALFDKIIDVLEEGFSNELLEFVNLSLWQLFTSFIFNERMQAIGISGNMDDVVTRAIHYMKNNLERSLSIDEIAEGVNCSGSYFFSLFKKRTGYSPIQYINQLKIQKGCQYLSFADLSIKELSSKIGFEDPFYFSRLFKKTMGISPLEYRNRYRE